MKTYIDEIVESVKDKAHINNDILARYYALLVLTKGENITLSDIHDAWAMSMNFRPKNEHCYGHDHISLVPFHDLSSETQKKDEKFLIRLKNIAKTIHQ